MMMDSISGEGDYIHGCTEHMGTDITTNWLPQLRTATWSREWLLIYTALIPRLGDGLKSGFCLDVVELHT